MSIYNVSENYRERFIAARILDKAASIPLIGRAAGVIRAVSSLALGFFAELGSLYARATKNKKMEKEYNFFVTRGRDERTRSFREIFPIISALFMNFDADSKRDNTLLTCTGQKSRITNRGGAYGTYMYVAQDGSILYSKHRGELINDPSEPKGQGFIILEKEEEYQEFENYSEFDCHNPDESFRL